MGSKRGTLRLGQRSACDALARRCRFRARSETGHAFRPRVLIPRPTRYMTHEHSSSVVVHIVHLEMCRARDFGSWIGTYAYYNYILLLITVQCYREREREPPARQRQRQRPRPRDRETERDYSIYTYHTSQYRATRCMRASMWKCAGPMTTWIYVCV